MKKTFDFDKEYGIVLEGGGAKGAYQIGVWKAFLECGVKIKGVSGVSVGALNGALICMGNYEKAVGVWKNISYSRIMKVDDSQMEKLVNRRFKELNLQTVTEEGRRFIIDGGIDVTPLRQLIDENVDEKAIRESAIDFIMGTFSISSMKELEISAKEAEDGYLKDYLMASSNFPLFKNEKLHGKTYLDGGIVNNVPIDMLINRGYKNIIVVRIYGIGMEKKIKIPEDVNIIYLAPRINLCNILEFNNKKAARNITLGYYDALRLLHSLSGRNYYIDAARSEMEHVSSLLKLEEDHVRQLLTYFKRDNNITGSGIRSLMEEVFPQMAASFKLGKNWTYSDLYFSIIEYCARKLKIKKYKIYTEKEFLNLIQDKAIKVLQDEGSYDIYMNLIKSIT
ncbi:MAG: Patatin [Herbinix sp.]|nr:Patatin [Herbinix sp.]